MVTMKDVAKHCGVSVSTVSRVLSGNELISPETTGLVLRAAEDLGYTPDFTARSLKTNRSDMIGILFDSFLTHPYFSRIIDAVRIHAEANGFDVLFLSRVKRNGKIDYTETALSRRMDGVLVVYADVESESIRKLTKGHIPVVSIDAEERDVPSVLSDYSQATEEMVDWIAGKGHRRIAFIHGEMGYATAERLKGFRRAMQKHGFDIPENYIRPGKFNDPERCARETESLLALPVPPSCILMPDDYSAVNALRILREKNLTAPADFSCAGYDGIPLSQAVSPRLTTFRQNTEEIGKKAVEMLMAAIQSGTASARSASPQTGTGLSRDVTVRGELIPGETVAEL